VLGDGERELGVDLEGLAELVAARGLAPARAMDEGEQLAHARLVRLREQAVVERLGEVLLRGVVLAGLVLLRAEGELVAGALAQRLLGDLRRGGLRRRVGRDDARQLRAGGKQQREADRDKA